MAEAKAQLSESLRQVEAGEKVTINQRGRLIGAIVPPAGEPKRAIDGEAIEAFRGPLESSRTPAARLVRRMGDAGF